MIIPSIDLMSGKAVQLVGGKEKALESERDPLDLVREFNRYGEVAVIDLDAALGRGSNAELIKRMCAVAECRVGGGIRTVEQANAFLRAGAKRIIIGTNATPEFLGQLPREKIIAAIDTKGRSVVTEGWTKATESTPQEKIRELEPCCAGFLFTNVDREGRMQGMDMGIVRELRAATKRNLTIAGGITTIEDIRGIEKLGCDSQIGMAMYTGKLEIADAFVALLDFGKNRGTIPTIVQEESGQVLMLAFSTPESVRAALTTGKGTYYSRSRKKIWTKGEEESGNTQELVKARYDCDRDALLFTVRQKNVACHMGSYSCFGEREFGIDELYATILSRKENPVPGSYTASLLSDEKLLKEKIMEEAQEIVEHTDRENLVWEVADLSYFVLVMMAREGITPKEVRAELEGRQK
jgi:phosphoribosylformimino-5-aminoimidazole carboxamide ribotide isomerase